MADYMRNLLFILFLAFSSDYAAAQNYEPDPLEAAPDGAIDCSWSDMKKEEYQECLKKKQYFAKMNPEEKAAYNADVKDRQLEERVRRLERRVEFLETRR